MFDNAPGLTVKLTFEPPTDASWEQTSFISVAESGSAPARAPSSHAPAPGGGAVPPPAPAGGAAPPPAEYAPPPPPARLMRRIKVPHMGWNEVEPTGSHYYFVHSYYVEPERSEDVMWMSRYGGIRC